MDDYWLRTDNCATLNYSPPGLLWRPGHSAYLQRHRTERGRVFFGLPASTTPLEERDTEQEAQQIGSRIKRDSDLVCHREASQGNGPD